MNSKISAGLGCRPISTYPELRVAPIGWFCNDPNSVLELAAASASVSHDHPEGVKAAQAVAMSVFLTRNGASKDEIRAIITELTGYDLGRRLKACDSALNLGKLPLRQCCQIKSPAESGLFLHGRVCAPGTKSGNKRDRLNRP